MPEARFAAAISEHPLPAAAIGEAVGEVLERVGTGAGLAALFVTQPHAGALEDMAGVVREILRPDTLIGCGAESVLANGHEVEGRAAVALWAGDVGPTSPVALWSSPDRAEGWPATLPFDPAALVLLADPFTFDSDALFAQLAADHPGLGVLGGNASGARGPGGTRLVLDGEVLTGGAVGAFVGLGAGVAPLVSQGSRPVGRRWTVTAADGAWVRELGGRPAWERLAELVEKELSEDDRVRVQRGLQLGVLVDEHRADFGPGDFIVRNLHSVDRATGALAVDSAVGIGQTVQFHVRDAQAADADLRHALLSRAQAEVGGVLLFTCNGRGTRLFGEADHDATAVADVLGGPATAGFFAQGEFGPVGGRNFVHGFSAAMALFEGR